MVNDDQDSLGSNAAAVPLYGRVYQFASEEGATHHWSLEKRR